MCIEKDKNFYFGNVSDPLDSTSVNIIEKKEEKSKYKVFGEHILFDYSGRAVYKNTTFIFTLNAQKSNTNYLYKGRITVLDVKTKMLKNKSGEIIRYNINTNCYEREDLYKKIANGVIGCYKKYNHLFGDGQMIISPEQITPISAFNKYGKSYIQQKHKKAKEITQNRHFNKLNNAILKLPNTKMNAITQIIVEKCKYSNNEIKLLKGFWDFCISNKFCIGKNPFEKVGFKKGFSKKVFGFHEIDFELQDMIYENLRKKMNGYSVAFALMIGGMINPSEIQKLTFENFTFKDEYDFVIYHCTHSREKQYTHNYSRPLFPQAAEILHRKYDAICKEVGEEAAKKYPVAGSTKDQKKALGEKTIRERFKNFLFRFLHSEAIYQELKIEDIANVMDIVKNTYKRTLTQQCNLLFDCSDYKYLTEESLRGSVSADNYIDFACDKGQYRLYKILKCTAENREITDEPEVKLYDGTICKKIMPEKTRENVSSVVQLTLAPGDTIHIDCMSGFTGKVTASKAM